VRFLFTPFVCELDGFADAFDCSVAMLLMIQDMSGLVFVGRLAARKVSMSPEWKKFKFQGSWTKPAIDLADGTKRR